VKRTSLAHDAASRVTAYRMANGTRASYTYDNANRVLCLANLGPGGVTLSSSSYAYDAANNRISLVGSDGSLTSWTYDKTYQLTAETRTGVDAYAVTYTYGVRGNRLTRWDGTALTTWSSDVANQLPAISSTGSPSTYAGLPDTHRGLPDTHRLGLPGTHGLPEVARHPPGLPDAHRLARGIPIAANHSECGCLEPLMSPNG
jgi:YD repeat-containing protein